MSRLFAVPNVLDSDDWYTPAWIFDGLGIEFDMDVAAPDGGAPNVPARRHLTVADDGLLAPWEGTVWCNPPYSHPAPWCRKWASHFPAGCILIRSDLSTSGPLAAFAAAWCIYVPPKRLQFIAASGRPSGAVNFSTVLLGKGFEIEDAMYNLSQSHGGTYRKLRAA